MNGADAEPARRGKRDNVCNAQAMLQWQRVGFKVMSSECCPEMKGGVSLQLTHGVTLRWPPDADDRPLMCIGRASAWQAAWQWWLFLRLIFGLPQVLPAAIRAESEPPSFRGFGFELKQNETGTPPAPLTATRPPHRIGMAFVCPPWVHRRAPTTCIRLRDSAAR